MKRVFSLLLALMVVFSMAVPAAAAENEGSVIFSRKNGATSFTCAPGLNNAYDLFDEGFKNVMPGDKIVGYVTIKGNYATLNEDSFKVWMRAMPHSEDGNAPITPGTGDIASMNDFLHQLNLKVYNENKDKYNPIFDAKADELDGLEKNVFLGSFLKYGKIVLRVELEVPKSLDSRYANRIGEVDWVFTVEAYDNPSVDNPKTGDYIMMAVAIMAISGVALVVLLVAKRKKKSN